MTWADRARVMHKCWGAIFLAIIGGGGIYAGVFTVSEAAAAPSPAGALAIG